mgnify:CR=1 FL=1
MARPVTLFTGQWADLPLEDLCKKAVEFGYDGLELACWGDHFEVRQALEADTYCSRKRDLLEKHGLQLFSISNHLVGQAVLDRIAERPYSVSGETLALDIAANPDTIQNIRLWDPRPLEAVLNQLQHLRLYYSFLDVDVDRYVVDGDYRQVLVGTRELFQNGLDDSAQNWVNRSLVYTHGYGLVMSTATEFNKAGQPLSLIHI